MFFLSKQKNWWSISSSSALKNSKNKYPTVAGLTNGFLKKLCGCFKGTKKMFWVNKQHWNVKFWNCCALTILHNPERDKHFFQITPPYCTVLYWTRHPVLFTAVYYCTWCTVYIVYTKVQSSIVDCWGLGWEVIAPAVLLIRLTTFHSNLWAIFIYNYC